MPKIVIDLDDDTYRVVKNELVIISGMRSYKTVFNKILDAIANGTVLPKHGRLIDADIISKQYGLEDATKYGNKDSEQQHHSYSTMMMYEIADMIDDAPTVIEADKSCSTCKYSDEVDGSNCYECVKGMKNNYEAEVREAIIEKVLEELPNGTTNGDMIKAMFPNEGDFETDFDTEWWNAPYKADGEDKERGQAE